MKNSFFSKIDWAAFWTATIVSFAVYFFTLGPSVGLEDSGELATAGAHLGVPHPPGYPFWTLCSWLFCKIFFWVSYMGHPSPAWAISCFSAVAGAFAAGCTAMLICRSSRDFIRDGENVDGAPDILSFGGGVAGALTFALSPVEWSQSTIVEIYSLNALFLMWVFLLSYRWMRSPSDKILFITAFVFGLGLTNYQVLLFAIVPLVIIIAVRNIGLFRDVFIYLVPVALTYQALKIGCLERASAAMTSDVINKHMPVLETSSCPSGVFVALGVLIVVAALLYACFRRGDRGRVERVLLVSGGAGTLALVAGATVFASPVEWDGVTAAVAPLIEPSRYVFTAAFLLASVVAAAYSAVQEDKTRKTTALIVCAALSLVAVLIAASLQSAGDLGYVGEAFPWGKSTLVFALLVVALLAVCAFVPNAMSFALPAAGVQTAVFILLSKGAMNGLTHPASWWFWWPVLWNFILLSMAFLVLPNGKSVAGAAFFAQLGVSFYVYMPIVSDLRNPPMNWGYPRTWEGFKHAIMREQYEAIAFKMPTWGGIMNYFGDVKVQFTDFLALLALVPFAAGHWIVGKANRKVFWQWMIAAAACFLMMSVLLIGLANVKGDVQDGFIQKVKFISSHAMIALWIGYGMVFVCALAARAFSRQGGVSGTPLKRLCIALSAVMILVAGVIPVVQNYTDSRLVFELGGAEQNGHTFGWQFGAYQLEGYKAINEQLVADEEPLPDPTYPPPMLRSSVFFGGTDPGRFVPTYMIYAANYRPDIYLITQNALADDTYMSVERDLYGDEIWIPAKEDSAEAFNIYVDEVQRGVRRANGDVKFENGRVQVTGALGVMEINSILTKMMFDHEKKNRAFYIEESYVIPWMYNYLVPHGLIMKIEEKPTRIDTRRARQDADFWDWYVRRLLKDPMYRRDFAAQKSFSKLRSAIAGLYGHEGMYRECAQAYREACLLYPISPEAVFRYAQESLLRNDRFAAVLDLMDMTDRLDPNNRRTARMREFINRSKSIRATLVALEPQLRSGRIDDDSRFVLATCYYAIGRVRQAADVLKPVASGITDPAKMRSASRIFFDAGANDESQKLLEKYLSAVPAGDRDAWLDLSRLQHRKGRVQDSQRSFVMAYRIDAKGTFGLLERDQELQTIAMPLFNKKGR